ncbi:hypothetical protein LTR85_000694 [Meristemomyces frigidus]|nr:hypothetical protein LTR85_000694 [Meristemomyces frigidus]
MSILLQYLRIFPQEKFRKACFTVMALVSIYSLWAVLSGIFACNPVDSFWDMSRFAWDQPGCLPRLTVWYTNAAINIATDVAIALLPLPVISSLQIPRRQRIILMGVFAAGLFTCFMSILRLIYIFPITSTSDVTWNSPLAAIWSCVETNIGIWCSCVPTLKGCVQRYYPKLLDSFHSASADSAGSMPSSATQDSVQKVEIELQGKGVNRIGDRDHLTFPPVVRPSNRRAHSEFSDTSSEEALVAFPETVPISCLRNLE